MITSLLCAAHCLLMPLVVGFLPLFGLSGLADERTEWLLIVLALVIGLCSLLPGFWRRHRKWQPLGLFAVGASLIVLVRLGLEASPSLELLGVVSSGVMLAAAHALNLRCACCAPPKQS